MLATSTSDPNPYALAEQTLVRAFLDGLKPDEELTVSQWADRYRWLSPLNPESGKWRTDRAPYTREPMDSLSAGSGIHEVAIQWAAQLGKTEILLNWLAHIADASPGPVMYVMPTEKTAKKASRIRVEPMFETTDRLRGKLKDKSKRDSGNNRLEKTFPGGILLFVGSNSAADLRAIPVKYIAADEIDEYPIDVDGQGDPLSIVGVRTSNFHGYKILKLSTPTFQGTSRIEQACARGDMRRYEVPCPHCRGLQHLEWKNLRWEEDKPETAAYACRHCGVLIEERFKPDMLAELGHGGEARWVPTQVGEPGVRSYVELNQLYSPLGWTSWTQLARLWIESEQDKEKRRAFVNLRLGQTWRDGAVVPKWETLWNRARAGEYREGTVPMRGLVLTAGFDVQENRIEGEIVAWGRGLESWSIDYFVLPGKTLEPEVWADLDKIITKTWPHESGLRLPLRMAAVDSRYESNTVYRWIRQHSPHQVVAVTGRDLLPLIVGSPTAVEVTEGGKKLRRGVRLWPVGSGLIKSQIYAWLSIEPPGGEGKLPPPGFMHFPKRSEEYFRMLTAETFRTRTIGGLRRRSMSYWEKTRERNEALDARIYARAAAAIAQIDRFEEQHWKEIEAALGLVPPLPPGQDLPETQAPEAPPPPPDGTSTGRPRSSYWNR